MYKLVSDSSRSPGPASHTIGDGTVRARRVTEYRSVLTYLPSPRLWPGVSPTPSAEFFPREVTTDRLRLVAAAETVDPFELYEHCREGAPHVAEVTRYLTWGPYATVNEAFEFLEICETDFEAGDAAHYAVYVDEDEPEPDEFAGMACLRPDWDRRLATLGTWFRKPFWGRGYSGERARALMEVAFDRLDLEVVAVTCHSGNETSRRAIRKYVEVAGGHEEGLLRNHARYGDEVVDVYRFSVSHEEWEVRREG